MKRIALAVAVLLSINISNIWAEGNSTNASSVRYVKAPRFEVKYHSFGSWNAMLRRLCTSHNRRTFAP